MIRRCHFLLAWQADSLLEIDEKLDVNQGECGLGMAFVSFLCVVYQALAQRKLSFCIVAALFKAQFGT